jgi:hypothetical protein
MRVPPPRVPKGAQAAFNASQGPRVLPGTYTVRLTKGKEVYEAPLVIGLDRRADYTADDRKVQFDAAMRVHGLFGDMSGLMDRISGTAGMAGQIAGKLPERDRLRRDLEAYVAAAEVIRKRIVATTEGGAITGEIRLREHTDELYGALMGYEGRPGSYLLERIDVLRADYAAIDADFAKLMADKLPGINRALEAKGLPAIAAPPAGPRTAGVRSADLGFNRVARTARGLVEGAHRSLAQ